MNRPMTDKEITLLIKISTGKSLGPEVLLGLLSSNVSLRSLMEIYFRYRVCHLVAICQYDIYYYSSEMHCVLTMCLEFCYIGVPLMV